MAESPPHWRPFHSVPSRIIFFVLTATLVTSLVVTWVSVRSVHGFLRTKIDQKFPVVLRSSVEALELWYAQRTLDVDTFARRELLVNNLVQLRDGRAPERMVSEMRDYLSLVLQRSPQYETLLLLDAEGETVLELGADLKLPSSVRSWLARVSRSDVSDVLPIGSRLLQIASAPMSDSAGRRIGSLHAVLRLQSFQRLLASKALGHSGRVFVVAADRTVLGSSGDGGTPSGFERRLPEPGAPALLEEYVDDRGRRVVGSSVHFPRFGWTVAVEQPYDEAFAPLVDVEVRVLTVSLAVVLVMCLVAYRITRSIVAPIEALSDGAKRILRGEYDVVIPTPWRRDEIALLIRTFNEMVAKLNANRIELQMNQMEIEAAAEQVRTRNQELQRANEVLSQLSITDGLTKLHNHRFFQDHLTREIKRVRRTQEPVSMLLIDIDDFKALNDRLGHAAGDELLKGIARTLNASVRESDFLARYGGEEFVVVAANTHLAGALHLAEKVRTEVAESSFVVDESMQVFKITVSIGVAEYRGDRKAFFQAADRALYRAKAEGKNCVVSDA